jgi:putative FmdB family regulatory protein
MPTYAFECKKCGHRFDREESIAEHDKHRGKKCPKCKGTEIRALISSVSVKTAKKS